MGNSIFGQTSEAVVKAFEAKYPKAEKVKWNIDSHGYHEAHFTYQGKKHRADFYDNGEWRETETSTSWKKLPAAVIKTLKNNKLDKDDIVEVEEVDSHTEGHFFDVESKKGKGKTDFRVKEDGTLLGTD